jgi:prefoldin beta subunit
MSGINQLPPSVQEKLQRLQQLQNTMQQLTIQRQRLEIEKTESEKALETLNSVVEGAKTYKSVGAVLVEKPKEQIIKELSERKEFLEMRAKVLSKQEQKTQERLTALQETLQKELGILTS